MQSSKSPILYFYKNPMQRPVAIQPDYRELEAIRTDYPELRRILDRAMIAWTSGVGIRRYTSGVVRPKDGGEIFADNRANPVCCLMGAAMLGLEERSVHAELGLSGRNEETGAEWSLAATGENPIATVGFGFDDGSCRSTLGAFGARVAAALNLPQDR